MVDGAITSHYWGKFQEIVKILFEAEGVDSMSCCRSTLTASGCGVKGYIDSKKIKLGQESENMKSYNQQYSEHRWKFLRRLRKSNHTTLRSPCSEIISITIGSLALACSSPKRRTRCLVTGARMNSFLDCHSSFVPSFANSVAYKACTFQVPAEAAL